MGDKLMVVVLFIVTLCSIIPFNLGSNPVRWFPKCGVENFPGFHNEHVHGYNTIQRSPYGNNERRVWDIHPTPPFRVEFDYLDLERTHDYVEVNGLRYSGTSKPPTQYVYKNSRTLCVIVKFVSDHSVTKSGFRFRVIQGTGVWSQQGPPWSQSSSGSRSASSYIGQGHYQQSNGYNMKQPLSLDRCKRHCINLGSGWNVVHYTYFDQKCTCYKNARGQFVRQNGHHNWRITG